MHTDLYSTTLRQLNAKIIPFIIICYFVANLDKTNISIAALQMNADLGLSASMYGLGVGMFYISYIIFEIPSNVIMTKVGARVWIARIMITGASSAPDVAGADANAALRHALFARHGGGGLYAGHHLLHLLLVPEE